MADNKASFVLQLIDKITAPARKMTTAAKSMDKAMAATKTSADSAAAAVTSVGVASEKAGQKALKGAAAMKRANAQMKVAAKSSSYDKVRVGFQAATRTGTEARFAGGRKVVGRLKQQYGPVLDRSAQGAAAGGMGPILNRKAQKLGMLDRMKVSTKPLVDWNKKSAETLERWGKMRDAFAKTPFGMAAKGFGSMAQSIGSAGLSLVSFGVQAVAAAAAIGGVTAALAAYQVVQKAAFAERSKKSLAALTGSAAMGEEAYKQARRVAKELGADAEHTVDSFIELRAAQFTLGQAETLVKLSADLATVTGKADAAERAIRAITQIKAKGKMQTEELLQLSEAGLSLELVFGELGKIMGKTTPELQKALQGGKVDAVKGIEAIQNAIMHKLHETEAGEMAKKMASGTLTGLMTQLQNMPSNLALDLGELINIDSAKGLVQDMLDAFAGVDKSKLASFFEGVIANVRELVRVAIQFAQGFLSHIDVVNEALGVTVDVGQWEHWGATAAEMVADVIRVVKWLLTIAGEFSSWVKTTAQEMKTWDAWDWTEKIVGLVPVLGDLLGMFVKLTAKAAEFLGIRDKALGIKKKVPPPPPPPIPHLFPYADPVIQQQELMKKIKTPAMGSAFPDLNHKYSSTKPGIAPVPRADIWNAGAGAGAGAKTNVTVGKIDVQVPANSTTPPAAFGKAVRDEVSKALSEFADRSMGELSS
jgi:tape measure domain-containing protein